MYVIKSNDVYLLSLVTITILLEGLYSFGSRILLRLSSFSKISTSEGTVEFFSENTISASFTAECAENAEAS